MTDRYASQSGSSGNDGLTSGAPWDIPTARSNLGGGGVDRILLLDGTITDHLHQDTAGSQGSELQWEAVNHHAVILETTLEPEKSWTIYNGIDYDTSVMPKISDDLHSGVVGIVIKNFEYIRASQANGTKSMTSSNHNLRASQICYAHGIIHGEMDESTDALRMSAPGFSVYFFDIEWTGAGHTCLNIQGESDAVTEVYDDTEPRDIILYKCKFTGPNHSLSHKEGARRTWVIDCDIHGTGRGEGDLVCTDNRIASCTLEATGGLGAKDGGLRVWSELFTVFGSRWRDCGSIDIGTANGSISFVGRSSGTGIRKVRNCAMVHCSAGQNYASVLLRSNDNTQGDGQLGPIFILNSILDSDIRAGDRGTATEYDGIALYCHEAGNHNWTGGGFCRGSVIGRTGDVVRWIDGETYTIAEAVLTGNVPKATYDIETNCVSGDPLFTDIDQGNFAVETGSPAIGIGSFSSVVTDGAGSTTSLAGTINLDRPWMFIDGNGCIDENGVNLADSMGDMPCGHFYIETTTPNAYAKCVITNVDYATDPDAISFTVASDINWPSGAEVYHRDPTNGLDAGAEVFTAPPGGPPTPSGDSPVLEAENTSDEDGANTTSHTVNLPASIAANDLLVVYFACDKGSTTLEVTWPAGWTELLDESHGNAMHLSIGYRYADGGEGATITITTDDSERSSHYSQRWSGAADPADTPPEIATAQGNDTTPTPVILTPGSGEAKYQWAAISCNDGGRTTSAFPSGYTNTGGNNMGSANAGLGYGTIASEASGETPGTFTINASDQWIAATLSIPPAASGELFQPFYPDDFDMRCLM